MCSKFLYAFFNLDKQFSSYCSIVKSKPHPRFKGVPYLLNNTTCPGSLFGTRRLDECRPRRVCSVRARSSKNFVVPSPDTAWNRSESSVHIHASNHHHAGHLCCSDVGPARIPLHSKAAERPAIPRMGLW